MQSRKNLIANHITLLNASECVLIKKDYRNKLEITERILSGQVNEIKEFRIEHK